jgi:spore germination protein GerM
MLFLFACFSTQTPTVQTPPPKNMVQKTTPPLPEGLTQEISIFLWNTDQQKIIPAQRTIETSNIEQQSLALLYEGPKKTESSLTLLTCKSTGAQLQSIQNGLARVQLLGECSSCGSMGIYDSIVATLKQFPSIQTVHVLDPQGNTQSDGDNIDARPACLNP